MLVKCVRIEETDLKMLQSGGVECWIAGTMFWLQEFLQGYAWLDDAQAASFF